jgi:biopolymer transport protein ExbD
MAAQPSRTPLGAITGINITPLVDITLVLLIIFMVTAKLIVGRNAMPVELPKAASGSEVQEIFSVVLSANGKAQVNGVALATDDELLPMARAQAKQNRELRAVIKADGKVFHERVMHTLDLLRRAGISKIAFGVVPLPADASTKNRVKSIP